MNIYGWNAGTGGVGWYRIREPLRGLSLRGNTTRWGPELGPDIVGTFDTILVHTLWQEQESEAWEILARVGAHRLIMDIDDDYWQADTNAEIPAVASLAKHYTPEVLRRLERNITLAHIITVPSPILAERIHKLNPNVYVLPNYVPESLLGFKREPPTDWWTIGYQGAPQHQPDVTMIAGELYRLIKRHRDLRCVFYGPGAIKAPDWPTDRLVSKPWEPDVPTYYRELARLCHVGIGPLYPHPFNDAKSAVRAIEYAALGIVGIFTDSPVYRGWVGHGDTGYLVPNHRIREWSQCISRLHNHPHKLALMSANGREIARHWTTEANSHEWEAVYRKA